MTAMAAFQLGKIAVPALGRFSGLTGKNQGGKIYGFNRGGLVPGSGNRDTVPAMLSPGEFVIKKSSVQSIGAENLARANKYANGTAGRGAPTAATASGVSKQKGAATKKVVNIPPLTMAPVPNAVGGVIMLPVGTATTYGGGGFEGKQALLGSQLPANIQSALAKKYTNGDVGLLAGQTIPFNIGPGSYPISAPQPSKLRGGKFASIIQGASMDAISRGVANASKTIGTSGLLDLLPALQVNESKIAAARTSSALDDTAVESMEGFIQEGVISAMTGAIPSRGKASFDLGFGEVMANKDSLNALYGAGPANQIALAKVLEVKRSKGEAARPTGIPRKLANYIQKSPSTAFSQGLVNITGFNKGGQVDTVPAMLTPGEYVINKSSAQSIGYGNLNKMNKTGVAHFNTGGPVMMSTGGTPASAMRAGQSFMGGGGNQNFMGSATLGPSLTAFAGQLKSATPVMTQIKSGLSIVSTTAKKFGGGLLRSVGPLGVLDAKFNLTGKAIDLLKTKMQEAAGKTSAAGTQIQQGGAKFAQAAGTVKPAPGVAPTGAAPAQNAKTQRAAGGGMGGLGNAAMMATFMAPMILESTNLSEANKKAASAALMVAGMLGMLIVPIGAMIDAKMLEVAASVAETSATAGEAAMTLILTSPFTILAVVVTAAIAALMFFQSKASEAAKELAESAAEESKRVIEGGGTFDRTRIKNELGGFADNANQAEALSFGNIGKQLFDATGISHAMDSVSSFMEGDYLGALQSATVAMIPFAGAFIKTREEADELGKRLKQKEAIEAFVDASAETAETLGNYNAAIKKNEQLQLKGMKAVNANIKATADFVGGQSRADKAMAKYEQKLKELGDQNIFEGEEFEAARDQLQNSREELAKANFEAAARVREGISTMIKDMRDSGKSFDEIFADPRYKTQLDQLTATLSKGFEKEILASGSARDEAMSGAGFGSRSFEDLSAAEKELVKTREKAIAKAKGQEQAEEARENLDKANKEAAAAEEERIRELKALKAAELELVRLERARTQAINKANRGFELASVAMGQIDSAVKGFSGSIQDAKVNVSGLIATLKDGFSPEAFAAARRISPEIAESIRSGLAKNKKLEGALDSLVEQFAGENLSNTQRKQALSDAGIDFTSLSDAMQEKLLKLFDDGFDSTDIAEATEILGAEVGHQVKLLQKLAKAQGDYVNVLSAIGDAVRKNKKEIVDAYKFEVDVRHKGINRILKATGQEMTARMARGMTNQKAAAAAGMRGPVNVAGLAARGQAMNARVNQIQQARNAAGPVVGTDAIKRDQDMANAQKLLQDEITRTKDALKVLADRSDEAAAVMEEIDREKGAREAMQGAIKDFTFATNEQRQGMNQEFMALQKVLQTGNINAIPDKFRAAVGKLLDQFKDVPIFGGMTGGDVSKNLQIRQMEQQFRMMSGGQQGVPPQLVKAIFEATTKEEKLINDLRQINKEEQDAAAALRKLEEQEANIQIEALTSMKTAAENLLQWLKDNTDTAVEEADNAGGAARGGFVPVRGFAKGGNVFKPRGTDTVPAMLTPGEFVIRKSAVDKIGVGALSALNNGNASTVYAAGGGFIEQGLTKLLKGSFVAKGDLLNQKQKNAAAKDPKVKNFAKLYGLALQGKEGAIARLFPDTIKGITGLQDYASRYGAVRSNTNNEGITFGRVVAKEGQLIAMGGDGNIYMNPALGQKRTFIVPSDFYRATFGKGGNQDPFAGTPFNHEAVRKAGANSGLYKRRVYHAAIKARKEDNTKGKTKSTMGAFNNAQSGAEGLLNAFYNPQFYADMVALRDAFTTGFGQRFRGTSDFAMANFQGFASGGSVDSVPAMLTPGEFVMSTAAVKKHGTGFMKQVNRGKVPGFARGGSVAGVQYRQNGGGIFAGRNALMEALDNVSQAMSAFNTVANALQDIATQFGNMQITHNVNVSGSLAIPGFTQEAINKLVNIIGDSVAGSTATKIDNAITMWQREQDGRVA